MKRTVSVLLALSMVLALGACNDTNISVSESSTDNTSVLTAAAPVKTVQHMTEEELSRVSKHALTLLDEPDTKDPLEEFNNSEHTLQIEYVIYTKETLLASIESYKDKMSDEEYQKSLDDIKKLDDDYKEKIPMYYLLDGKRLLDMSVFTKPYDGGSIDFTSRYEEGKVEEHHFKNLDEYLDYIKDQ